jgi:hypothetical protein
MEPFLLLAIGAAAAAGAAFGLTRKKPTWTCTWGGHELRVVVTPSRKVLLVDGREVAAKTTLAGAGASLTWASADPRGQVVVTVRYADPEHPRVKIAVDGVVVGGEDDPLPIASGEPEDPRWTAARALLADLGRAEDPRARAAAVRVEAGLRDVLGRADRLAVARRAHGALGGQEAAVDAAAARIESQVAELLGALRELHLVALSGQATVSLEPVEETIARIAAEAEVAGW